jgi:sigma-B regulation protein RsbU (phosphoserine phosphatase)
MFASVFFAILDPATGALAYINAGHEPPIIFNTRGVKTQLTRTGMVVGLMPDRPYTVRRARLKPGDTLLAFTDGVTDAMNARGESFDRERLIAMLAPASAADLLDAIETRVRAHIADANQFDDITMLAVRRNLK